MLSGSGHIYIFASRPLLKYYSRTLILYESRIIVHLWVTNHFMLRVALCCCTWRAVWQRASYIYTSYELSYCLSHESSYMYESRTSPNCMSHWSACGAVGQWYKIYVCVTNSRNIWPTNSHICTSHALSYMYETRTTSCCGHDVVQIQIVRRIVAQFGAPDTLSGSGYHRCIRVTNSHHVSVTNSHICMSHERYPVVGRPIWCRVAKTHRMPYLCWSFSAKEPYNWWLFCGQWPAI